MEKVWCLLAVSICAPGLAPAQTGSGRAHSTVLRRPADPAYLGVGVIELTGDRAKALGLHDARGVEVKLVERPSAADRAGIREDDVIVEVNGRTIEDVNEFIHAVADANPGAKVTLTVWREGSKQKLTATLESRPENPFFGLGAPDVPVPPDPLPAPPFLAGSPALIGFEGETLTPQLADYFGVKMGVLVRTVNSGTPAERAGLKAGDVVTKVNGTPVASPREISALARVSRKRQISLTVVRNRKEMTLDVEIAEDRSPFALFEPWQRRVF